MRWEKREERAGGVWLRRTSVEDNNGGGKKQEKVEFLGVYVYVYVICVCIFAEKMHRRSHDDEHGHVHGGGLKFDL